jgi:hypothetical protein
VERNCLATTEVESVSVTGDWVYGSTIAGHSGAGYFTWNGANHFPSQEAGQYGLLSYSLQISRAGNYRVAIRNYHSDPDSTESNDCWLKVGSNGWVKVYSEKVAVWQWMTKMDLGHHDAERPPIYYLGAGSHTLQISGRSHGFSIDKVHVYDESCANTNDALNPQFSSQALARRAGDTSVDSTANSGGAVGYWAVGAVLVAGVALVVVKRTRHHNAAASEEDADDQVELEWEDQIAAPTRAMSPV